MQHQLDGIEKLEGTYPFTLKTSVKAYRLNKFLHELIRPGSPAPLSGRSGSGIRRQPG